MVTVLIPVLLLTTAVNYRRSTAVEYFFNNSRETH